MFGEADMAAKISGGKAKQFFIDHGEKVGLGIIGAVSLYALGTANWIPYGGDPYAITREADEAKVAYDAREFTDESRKEYALVVGENERPAALVDGLVLSDWQATMFDLKVPFTPSPKDKGNPLLEVDPFFARHPIRNLVADSGRILLNLGPEVDDTATPAAGATADDDALAAADATAVDDEFVRNIGAAGGGAGGPGAMGTADPSSQFFSPESAIYSQSYSQMASMAGANAPGASSSGGYGGGSGLDYGGVVLKGRGQHYVSVRGIIPLHELIRAVQESRSCDFSEAAQHFQIIDYVLERQTRKADGSWPADDQWVEVDRTTAAGILDEVDGIDLDPVPPPLTDPSVTMPLPPRITGQWRRLATHPDIENFSLSPEDMEAEFKFQLALLEKARAAAAATAQPADETELTKGGWADRVYDSRALQSSVMGSSSMYSTTSYTMPSYATSGGSSSGSSSGSSGPAGYTNPYGGGAPGASSAYSSIGPQQSDPKFEALVKELADVVDQSQTDTKLRDYIKTRISAVGNILLFRFIDFAVEPGQTYRYRARLVLENPNRLDRVSAALDASVVQGDTRHNAWSNITTPVTVNRDTFYFVENLDLDRGKAYFDFFHFDPALGTVVTNTEPDETEDPLAEEEEGATPARTPPKQGADESGVKRLEVAFGEPIQGALPIWELSPAANTFAKDELPTVAPPGTKADEAEGTFDGDPEGYVFNSGDLLVAGLGPIRLDRTEHAASGLTLPREQNYDLQLVSAVLVAKPTGGFSSIDTLTQATDRAAQEKLREDQNDDFRYLKLGPAGVEGEELTGFEDIYGTGEMDAAGGDRTGGGRRANTRSRSALRKTGTKADAGVRGMQGGRGMGGARGPGAGGARTGAGARGGGSPRSR
jgi:hypothetical protein